MGRPRSTPEQKALSLERERKRQRERNHQPSYMAAKHEWMKRYNQRPDVIERRRWYYDNVALPRMCGLLK